MGQALNKVRLPFILMVGGLLFATSATAAVERVPDEQTMSAEEREMMELEPARKYMLKLINRDRATVGAKPLVLDEVATKAGQMHSDEMAINGYISHWTMDGKKPDQRYTESGGKDTVMENAYGSLEGTAYENAKDPTKLPLHSAQVFHRYELDKIEQSFFGEKPPMDGHRKNIIDPQHTSVGIGLSFAAQFGSGTRTACAQEFINHYGDIDDIPQKVLLGDSFKMQGTLAKGIKLKIVDLRWEPLPKPMTVAELNKTYSYSIPDKVVTSYFADPTQTDDPIRIEKIDDQEKFVVDIKTNKDWQPGLYYVLIWADLNNGSEEAVISTHTIELAAKE